MRIEITMKATDEGEGELDMRLSSEDTYKDLLAIEFMDREGKIRGSYEISKEEFISAVKQFDKGD